MDKVIFDIKDESIFSIKLMQQLGCMQLLLYESVWDFNWNIGLLKSFIDLYKSDPDDEYMNSINYYNRNLERSKKEIDAWVFGIDHIDKKLRNRRKD